MRKADIERATRQAYKELAADINRRRLAVIHAKTTEQEEEERAKLRRAEQQIVGVTRLVNEIQRKTGYTLKTY